LAYDIGQVYEASVDITADGIPVNPSQCVLTVTWRNPAGPQTSAFALTPGPGQGQLPPPAPAGHVFYDWTFTEPALYKFAWVPAGPGAPTSDYVSCRNYIAVMPLAEAADWLGVRDSRQFPKVRMALALATKLAEDVVGTTVCRRFVDDFIPGSTRPVIRLPHAPLPDSSSVESVRSVIDGGPAWGPADLYVNPAAGTIRLKSQLPFYFGPWLATYTGGRIEVSEAVVGGTREILWDIWATQRWLFADSTEPEMGDVALFEGRLPPGWTPPRRAMEWFGSEQQPSFG
jgi:hypothetical protein